MSMTETDLLTIIDEVRVEGVENPLIVYLTADEWNFLAGDLATSNMNMTGPLIVDVALSPTFEVHGVTVEIVEKVTQRWAIKEPVR